MLYCTVNDQNNLENFSLALAQLTKCKPSAQSVLNTLSRLTAQGETAIAAFIPHRHRAQNDHRTVYK